LEEHLENELYRLANYGDAFEAEHVCSVLQEHGIDAFVDGANASSMMSHVGSALGGVSLFVRLEDKELADSVVQSLEESHEYSAPWFCANCSVEVDGHFQVCWSCSNARAEVEGAFPETAQPVDAHLGNDESVKEITELSTDDKMNPYIAPRSVSDGKVSEDPSVESPTNSVAEKWALNAFRASIISVFLPLIANAYSMYLLFRAGGFRLSQTGKARFWAALVINVFVLIFLFLIWR
jgi:hypothetical protein